MASQRRFNKISIPSSLTVGALFIVLGLSPVLDLVASTSQRTPPRNSGGSTTQRLPPRSTGGSTTQRLPPRRTGGSAIQRPLPPRNGFGPATPPSSTPERSESRPYSYVPIKLSQKTFESWLFSLPRRNVSIHSVDCRESGIRIEGSYTDAGSLRNFAEALKGDGKRDLTLETKTYYRMGINHDYVITLENEF